MQEKETRGRYAVVVGLDFSDLANRAVHEAIDMAGYHPRAELHVMVVGVGTSEWLTLPGDREAQADAEAREVSRRRVAALIEQYARERGIVPVESIAVYTVAGNPAPQIVSLAASVEADMIVVGTHGRSGVRHLLLGSVAEEIVRTAPCSVVVLRAVAADKLRDVPAPPPAEHVKRFPSTASASLRGPTPRPTDAPAAAFATRRQASRGGGP